MVFETKNSDDGAQKVKKDTADDDDDENTCNFDEDEIGKMVTLKKAEHPTSTTL